MALVVNDRVKETTAVVGTGIATLLGAALGFQSFAVIGNGNTTYYCISDQGGANWEVGIGTYTSAGTTLARTTVLASSNGGALVVFTAGVKDVFVTYPAEKGVWYDASGNVLFTGTTTAANLAYTGTLTGSTGILNIGSGQVYKDSSGNVGLGITLPSEKLMVQAGNIFSNGGYFRTNRSSASADTTAGLVLQIDGVTQAQITAPTSSSMAMYTGGTERMRIDVSGNVGIGTSSPSSYGKLTVTQPTLVNTSTIREIFVNAQANTTANTSGALSGITFRFNTTDYTSQFNKTSGIYGLNTDSGAGGLYGRSAGLVFYTSEVDSTALERMRIDSSGNLLVGTTSAVGKLTVAGTISCSSGFASDVTLTDTTLTTYTAGTYYTLPGTVLVPLGNTYLVSILFTYDNISYHNWCGGGIIGLTDWQAGGTNTTWAIPMDTHVDGAQTITIKGNTSNNYRTLSWTPSVTKTVTTGGSIVVRLKLISTF